MLNSSIETLSLRFSRTLLLFSILFISGCVSTGKDILPELTPDDLRTGDYNILSSGKILIEIDGSSESLTYNITVNKKQALVTFSNPLIGDLLDYYVEEGGEVTVTDLQEGRRLERYEYERFSFLFLQPEDLITAVTGRFPKKSWLVSETVNGIITAAFLNVENNILIYSTDELTVSGQISVPKRIRIEKENRSALLLQKKFNPAPYAEISHGKPEEADLL